MGLMTSLGLARGAVPALGGVSRDLAQSFAPEIAKGLAEAMERIPMPDTSALPAPRPGSGYDRLIDALNRLPRPLMAFGSQALVLYALIDPAGFAARMAGLDAMPEALWWLIGAVITAYFGAREAHHMRQRSGKPPVAAPSVAAPPVAAPVAAPAAALGDEANPALDEWRMNG